MNFIKNPVLEREFLKTVYSFQMEACLAESLEIVQGLDRKRDFKSEFKANLKELKSTRKFKKNKKEQLEKLKGKSLASEF